MSVRVQTYVWQLDLHQGQKLVALALADHCHDDGSEARPSRSTLAEKCGMSERQITRVLGQLVELGVVEIERPASQHYCTVYRFVLPEDFAVIRGRQPVRKPVANPVDSEIEVITAAPSGETPTSPLDIPDGTFATSGATFETLRGDVDVTLTIKNHQENHPKSNTSIIENKSPVSASAEIVPVALSAPPSPATPKVSASDAFEAVWAIYPRKVGRGAAQKQFSARLREGVALHDLIAATEAYSQIRVGLEPTYTMHASTFFGKAGRWRDYLPDGAAIREAVVESKPAAFSAIASWLAKAE